MSTNAAPAAWEDPGPPDASAGRRALPALALGDSFLLSAAVLAALFVAQRGLGFGRSLLLCRWLEVEQLGQWELARALVDLLAPIAVLGVPGCFGRYAQGYLLAGQLRSFVRQTALVSACLAGVAVVLVWLGAEQVAAWALGDPASARLVRWIACGLGAVVVYNFATTLLSALCLNRAVARLELGNNVLFTVGALVCAGLGGATAATLVVVYLAAYAWSAASAVWRLRGTRLTDQASPERSLGSVELWRRIAPFALTVWGSNWLANLNELADRLLLVHLSGLAQDQALLAVGQYASARVLPLLLLTLTTTLATMATPYLSRHWEAGRPDLAGDRLNLLVKVVGFGLVAAGGGLLLVAPWVFSVAWQDKFPQGLAILPGTVAACVWFGLARITQKYLWCAERVGLSLVTLAAGLGVTVGLAWWLLPTRGLAGLVVATSIGNLVGLVLCLAWNWRLGQRFDPGVCLVSLLPALLWCGAGVTFGGLVAAATAVWFSPRLMSAADRELFARWLAQARQRLARSG